MDSSELNESNTSLGPIENRQERGEWKHEAVLFLINKYEEHKDELEKKNSMKKHIWRKIAEDMNFLSYKFTWDQLQNKWKSLVRTYKSVKDHNSETGRNRRSWPYFEHMDRLLANNPIVDPPVVMHNGQRIVRNAIEMQGTSNDTNLIGSQNSPTGSLSDLTGEEFTNSDASASPRSKTCKRKRSNDLHDLLHKAMEQSQKQHEEDLQEKKRFNDLLEILIKNTSK